MSTATSPFLFALLAIGCSGSPTGPSIQSDPTAPSAAPSVGIEITVKTTGQNIPTELKYFVCKNPVGGPSQALGLSFMCRLSSSAFGAIAPNGSIVTPKPAGVWRVGLDLPGNCQPVPPFAEFWNHSVVSPVVTVRSNEVTPVTFSIACL